MSGHSSVGPVTAAVHAHTSAQVHPVPELYPHVSRQVWPAGQESPPSGAQDRAQLRPWVQTSLDGFGGGQPAFDPEHAGCGESEDGLQAGHGAPLDRGRVVFLDWADIRARGAVALLQAFLGTVDPSRLIQGTLQVSSASAERHSDLQLPHAIVGLPGGDAPSPDAGLHCVEVGTGESYARCSTDAQCPAQAPFCRVLGLYGGGDFNCNFSVRICRATNRDDCRP
jgi:hypothetical protein